MSNQAEKQPQDPSATITWFIVDDWKSLDPELLEAYQADADNMSCCACREAVGPHLATDANTGQDKATWRNFADVTVEVAGENRTRQRFLCEDDVAVLDMLIAAPVVKL